MLLSLILKFQLIYKHFYLYLEIKKSRSKHCKNINTKYFKFFIILQIYVQTIQLRNKVFEQELRFKFHNK